VSSNYSFSWYCFKMLNFVALTNSVFHSFISLLCHILNKYFPHISVICDDAMMKLYLEEIRGNVRSFISYPGPGLCLLSCISSHPVAYALFSAWWDWESIENRSSNCDRFCSVLSFLLQLSTFIQDFCNLAGVFFDILG